jgi:hypothetical protein
LKKIFRVGKQMTDAILTVLRYVRDTTGTEPTQEELADALKSYFILNEIGNQIQFQRKNPLLQEKQAEPANGPFWKLNMMAGPPKNSLVRVGLFYEDILVAIKTAQSFVKNSSGNAASQAEIAKSLECDFILSEIKNQIDWQRNSPKKAAKSGSNPKLTP